MNKILKTFIGLIIAVLGMGLLLNNYIWISINNVILESGKMWFVNGFNYLIGTLVFVFGVIIMMWGKRLN